MFSCFTWDIIMVIINYVQGARVYDTTTLIQWMYRETERKYFETEGGGRQVNAKTRAAQSRGGSYNSGRSLWNHFSSSCPRHVVLFLISTFRYTYIHLYIYKYNIPVHMLLLLKDESLPTQNHPLLDFIIHTLLILHLLPTNVNTLKKNHLLTYDPPSSASIYTQTHTVHRNTRKVIDNCLQKKKSLLYIKMKNA